MSVFPLDFVRKEDTAERLLALANLPEKHKFSADDQNLIFDAVNELHGRGFYLLDNDGLKWYVRKGDGNLDNGSFQDGDKIEAWIDLAKTKWREVLLVGNGFSGIASLADKQICFITNKKTRLV